MVQTPNILGADEYRSFWVSWNGLSIRLGRQGETDPIVTLADTKARQLSYVSFSVKGGDSQVHWRFECKSLNPKIYMFVSKLGTNINNKTLTIL